MVSVNVIDNVVKRDLCCGCGVCVAICPKNALEMISNKFGEYNPTKTDGCIECGLCLKVCPFNPGNDNENEIGFRCYGKQNSVRHNQEVGYYIDCFVGWVNSRNRLLSASGGLTTWIFERLFLEEKIDYAICVVPNVQEDMLFRYSILGSPSELDLSRGSVYYPVELSGIIHYILTNPGRYAIVGLPCYIKSLRLAQERYAELNRRVICTIGLVCNHQNSKLYTSYLSEKSGISNGEKEVKYRGKPGQKSAGDFWFRSKDKKGNYGRKVYFSSIARQWGNRWFGLNCCNYCDDVFAECADIALMDAWLPECMSEFEGTNLVIVRNEKMKEILLEGGRKKAITLKNISVDRIIQSQSGNLKYKRKELSLRLGQQRIKLPRRVEPQKSLNPLIRKKIHYCEEIQKKSKILYLEHLSNKNEDISHFDKEMTRLEDKLSRIELLIAMWQKLIRNRG